MRAAGAQDLWSWICSVCLPFLVAVRITAILALNTYSTMEISGKPYTGLCYLNHKPETAI